MIIPVELAAQYILQTEAPLSDIALQCGFTDQAHLRKHFRQSTGQPPAAWRHAHRTPDTDSGVMPSSSQKRAGDFVPQRAREMLAT
jgi:AraC-like DNA-binding protein